MVTSRVRLEPWVKQRAALNWRAQQTADKHNLGTAAEEAMLDPTGVGFAFGGIYPGLLHSKGHLHEAHKVHFSISKAGRYLLHVRLHTEGRPVPGSPFALVVVPGAAHGSTTELVPPSQPLRGEVGIVTSGDGGRQPTGVGSGVGIAQQELGCSLVLCTSDRSGNRCIQGGATVAVTCTRESVKCKCVDREDGTYLLSWKSTASTHGVVDTKVTVNGVAVINSPMKIQLISTQPLSSSTQAISLGCAKSEAELTERTSRLVAALSSHGTFQDLFSGQGLRTAVAGEPTSVLLRFRDEYGNPATPADGAYKVGLSISNAKAKVNDLEMHADVKGAWGGEDTGLYTLTYVAKAAGTTDLTLWCETPGGGRELLPGSPYPLNVMSGDPTAAASFVDGFTSEQASKRAGDRQGSSGNGDKSSKSQAKQKGAAAEESTVITAGDSVILRCFGVDEFSNPAQNPPEGSFTAKVVLPGGAEVSLPCHLQQKAAKTATYDIRHETEKSGEHEMHVLLNGVPISGSPARYVVEPDKAVPSTSRLITLPDAERLPISQTNEFEAPSVITLATRDRFGNACNTGGLRVAGRLHLIKQNNADNTILMPNNHQVVVDDLGNGMYAVKVGIIMPATVKLVVNMDKDLPGTSGELAPMQLNFIK